MTEAIKNGKDPFADEKAGKHGKAQEERFRWSCRFRNRPRTAGSSRKRVLHLPTSRIRLLGFHAEAHRQGLPRRLQARIRHRAQARQAGGAEGRP